MSTDKKAIARITTDDESGVTFAAARLAPQVEERREGYLDVSAIAAAQSSLHNFEDRLSHLTSMSSVFDDDEDGDAGPISLGGHGLQAVIPVAPAAQAIPAVADSEDDGEDVFIGGMSDDAYEDGFAPGALTSSDDDLLAAFGADVAEPALVAQPAAPAQHDDLSDLTALSVDFSAAAAADIAANEAATRAALARSDALSGQDDDLAYLADTDDDLLDDDAGTVVAGASEFALQYDAASIDDIEDQDLGALLSRTSAAQDADAAASAAMDTYFHDDLDVGEAQGDLGDAAEDAAPQSGLDAPRPDWGFIDDGLSIPGATTGATEDDSTLAAEDLGPLGVDDPAIQSRAWEFGADAASAAEDLDDLLGFGDVGAPARDGANQSAPDEVSSWDWAEDEPTARASSTWQNAAAGQDIMNDISGDTGLSPVNEERHPAADMHDVGDASWLDADGLNSGQGLHVDADDLAEGDMGLDGEAVDADLPEQPPAAVVASRMSGARRVLMAGVAVVMIAVVGGSGFLLAQRAGLLGNTPAPSSTKAIETAKAPATPEIKPVAPKDANPAASGQAAEKPATDLAAGADVTGNPKSGSGLGEIGDLAMDPIPAPAPINADIKPAKENEMELDKIARGLENAADGNLDSLFLNPDKPNATVAPPAFNPAVVTDLLVDYAKKSDIDETRAAIELLFDKVNTMSEEVVERDQRIVDLEARLADANAKAVRAETLALAQNEVLVEFVRVQEKVDMAESLIVDLSRRIASMETTDPADRVAVERSLADLTTRIEAMARDIGLVARIAINGSPEKMRTSGVESNPVPGSETVYATTKSTAAPQGDPGRVPSNVKVGDFVEGYGYVLQIMPTSDGARVVVMENNSVLLPK